MVGVGRAGAFRGVPPGGGGAGCARCRRRAESRGRRGTAPAGFGAPRPGALGCAGSACPRCRDGDGPLRSASCRAGAEGRGGPGGPGSAAECVWVVAAGSCRFVIGFGAE